MQPISYQTYVLVLLFAILIVNGTLTTLNLIVLQNQQQQNKVQQITNNKTGTRIINTIFDRLDDLHNQSSNILASQSGLSNNTHLLQQLLGNVTEINKGQ